MVDTYTVGTTGKATILKDDKAVLDYIFDWSSWLAPMTDTLINNTITITGQDNTLVNNSATNDDTSVIVWLSGGTIGQTYQVECEITTVSGRTDERSIYIKIQDR
jgi:hypothetical protein